MSVSAQVKRIEALERQMSPTDWAVWVVDEARRHESREHFYRVIVAMPMDASPFMRPKLALEEQAKGVGPGRSADADERRHAVHSRLLVDFQSRLRLLIEANAAVQDMMAFTAAEIAAVRAEVHVLALRQEIAPLIASRNGEPRGDRPDNAHPADAGPLGVAGAEARDLQPISWQQPSLTSLRPRVLISPDVETVCQHAVVISQRVVGFQAAAEIVQSQCFRNHPILYRDVEAALSSLAQAATDAISHFNGYVTASVRQIREELAGGEVPPVLAETEGLLTIDAERLTSHARSRLAPGLAQQWICEAQDLSRAEMAAAMGDGGRVAWSLLRESVVGRTG